MTSKVFVRNIFSYRLKGTPKQLDEMYKAMNYEPYESKLMQKYFYCWEHRGTGRYYFPKEKYFVSRTWSDGTKDTDYVKAFIRYSSGVEVSPIKIEY